MTIDVDASDRRRGAGKRLLDELLRGWRPRGVREVRLEVDLRNAAAIRFYERMGFREKRRLPDYYGPGLDGMRMVTDVRRREAPAPQPPAVRRNPALRDDVRRHRAVVERLRLLDHPVDVEEQARLGDVPVERPEHRLDHLRWPPASPIGPMKLRRWPTCAISSVMISRSSVAHAVAGLRLVGEDVVEDRVDVEVERQPHQLADEGRRRHERLRERAGRSCRRGPSTCPSGTHSTRSRWKVRNISWKSRTWLNSSHRW